MANSIFEQMIGFSLEKRPVKRPRLGPPDVYPQDPKQREDELTAVNVKQGFSHVPIADEFGTAKNCSISAAKLGAFINGTIARKMEINILPDTGKKRSLVNTKDHFWPVTPRLKNVVDSWMKDLAGGKSLSILGKKVPIFNKREEIFLNLAENTVPMLRASWFLKMTASYNTAISEAKTKKRQLPDPSQEWTISLQRFLKDILMRLHYNGSGTSSTNPSSNNPNGGAGTPNQTTALTTDEGNLLLRQWNYCTELAKHLFEEGLLDRYEWLQWVIDAIDRAKNLDDTSWKILVPLLLTYIPDISQSELLARRLANLASRRLSTLFTDFDSGVSPQGQIVFHPPAVLLDHLQCPSHRSTVLALVSALQVITLECPTAMVYNANGITSATNSNDSANNSSYNNSTSLDQNSSSNKPLLVPIGSPLDLIPIPPSALPMPPRSNNPVIRMQLRHSEELIRQRSIAVEAKWACEEWQLSSAAATLQKVLLALDALDKHIFDKVESNNSIDSLYSKIFLSPPSKENPVEIDAPIVLLLCKWAVGNQRSGEHRALAVARILEHRQADTTTSHTETDPNKDKDKESTTNANGSTTTNGTNGNEIIVKTENSEPVCDENGINNESSTSINNNNNEGNGNGNGNSEHNSLINGTSTNGQINDEDSSDGYSGLPIYHNLLFNFLDTEAPELDEASPHSKSTFASLVHLFAALIRHDIFSHDAYLCTLVARGDLSTCQITTSQVGGNVIQPSSVATPGPGPGPMTPASVSSGPGTTPYHDNNMDGGPLFPPLPKLPDNITGKQPDYDDRNIDDDLDKILQNLQNNMDQVDSPGKEDTGFQNTSGSSEKDLGLGNNDAAAKNSSEFDKSSRHKLYVAHFPLPNDDSFQHESNQRQILLYGVGKMRDEAKYVVKNLRKDLTKILSKKFCYDVADGSRLKKNHSRSEINLETLQMRFASLTYFDQNSLTSNIGVSLIEMYATFASGRSNYLPTVEHVAFLTELMEMAYNINGLVDTCSQIIRELADVEIQLCQRGSQLTGSYCSSLLLQLVAVLRRYHGPLLLDVELTIQCWEGLTRLMKRFVSSSESASSAERCTLAYLTEIQTCCHFLRTKGYNETLAPITAKFRQNYNNHSVEGASLTWNNTFMTNILDNPRKKVDPSYIHKLIETPSCRYSFVCNAILSICNEVDSERLNDLASLCAEMTAACPSLANEWLTMLQSICSPSRSDRTGSCYSDVLREKVKDLSIHSSLASLTALLVARQCFSLENFVIQAVPSLLKAWNDGKGPNDPDIEAGARLTCHLLLSLFKTQDLTNSSTTTNSNLNVLKLSCDRRLLSATHNSISLGPLIIVLKAILLLADAAGSGPQRVQRNIPGITQGELSLILGTSDKFDIPADRSESRGEPRSLSSFALNALQQVCGEPWVRQRCLQNPEELCTTDLLLDPIISTKQAQRLLHLICYPDMSCSDDNLDAKALMEGLDQWNLREAWLGLTLQSRQLAGNNPLADHQNWLDSVAKSTIEVFRLEDRQDLLPPTPPGKSPRNSSGKKQQDNKPNSILSSGNNSTHNRRKFSDGDIASDVNKINNRTSSSSNSSAAWLIAPLISRLSPLVQGRVLKHASYLLESTLYSTKKDKSTSTNGPAGSLDAHLPFLALILTCLKGQDEQREHLLASLLTQFNQIISLSKETIDQNQNNEQNKGENLRDALRLRLSLVGGVFESIQKSSLATSEWAIVLTQLVTSNTVDLETNADVYPTVIDMVTALVHSTQVTEPNERVEEMRKQNLNLIKKLKKELMDRNSDCIKPLRQLLPLSKVQSEIIVTQPTSTIVDSKGNRIQSSEYVDKKPGLQVWEKQKVFPWEVLEGQRNPAPLSWAWFGAVKMERKPLRYEDSFRLLKYHTHNMVKPSSYFLEPVPLPPEDIDMKREIIEKEEIIVRQPDTPSSDCTISPRGPAQAKKPRQPAKRKRTTKAQQQAAAQVVPPPSLPPPSLPPPPPINTNAGSPYGGVGVGVGGGPPPNQIISNTGPPPYNPPGPPPQWFNNNNPGLNQQQQQQVQQVQNPNTFYSQQNPQGQQGQLPQQQQLVGGPGGVGVGVGNRPINQSKQALHNLLRARHPGSGPGPGPGSGNVGANQYQNFQQGPGPGPGGPQQPIPGGQQGGPQGGPNPRHQILRQHLRGPAPNQVQNFPQQQQQQQQQSVGGMNPMYAQTSSIPHQNVVGGGLNPQQQQQQQQQPNYGSGGGIGYNQGIPGQQVQQQIGPGPGNMNMNNPQQQQQQLMVRGQVPQQQGLSDFHPGVGRGIGRPVYTPNQQQQIINPNSAMGMVGGNYNRVPGPGNVVGAGVQQMNQTVGQQGGGMVMGNQSGMMGGGMVVSGAGGQMGQMVGGGSTGQMQPNMPNQNTQRLRQIMMQNQQNLPRGPMQQQQQQHYNPNQPGNY